MKNDENKQPKDPKSNDLIPEPKQDEIDATRDLFIRTLAGDDNRKIVEMIKLIRTPNAQPKQNERVRKLMSELAASHALASGKWLQNITKDDNDKFGLAEMRKNLIAEYGCTTASALALTDRVVASYWRCMCYDVKIQDFIKSGSMLLAVDPKASLLKELHRGLELASREFTMTLTMLRSFKQPNLKINVKTDTAYFGQNQQIINQKDQQKPENIDGEIIKPK